MPGPSLARAGAPRAWCSCQVAGADHTPADMGSTHAENAAAIGSVMPFVVSVMLTLVQLICRSTISAATRRGVRYGDYSASKLLQRPPLLRNRGRPALTNVAAGGYAPRVRSQADAILDAPELS